MQVRASPLSGTNAQEKRLAEAAKNNVQDLKYKQSPTSKTSRQALTPARRSLRGEGRETACRWRFLQQRSSCFLSVLCACFGVAIKVALIHCLPQRLLVRPEL